jgi:hypothetical protein
MVQDATVSVSSMQGLVTSKDQEIKFYKSQLGELAHYRETSADTEKQVMKLRESLDFKVCGGCKSPRIGYHSAESVISA